MVEYERDSGSSSSSSTPDPLPEVYSILNDKRDDPFIDMSLYDLFEEEKDFFAEQRFYAAMYHMKQASKYVGRIFFDRSNSCTQQAPYVRNDRWYATCILIGPGIVITSRWAVPRNEEQDEQFDSIFAIFSVYGNPYTAHRFELELVDDTDTGQLYPENDVVFYRFKNNIDTQQQQQQQHIASLNLSNTPNIVLYDDSNVLEEHNSMDRFFLVGFPAFLSEEFSSCLSTESEEQEVRFRLAMKDFSTKLLILFDQERDEIQRIGTNDIEQSNLIKMNHKGIENMTGTSGFAVYKYKETLFTYEEQWTDSDNIAVEGMIELHGIILLNNFAKTIYHLSSVLLDQLIYLIDGNITHLNIGQMRVPRGTFQVKLSGQLVEAKRDSTDSTYTVQVISKGDVLTHTFTMTEWENSLQDDYSIIVGNISVQAPFRVIIRVGNNSGRAWLSLHSLEFNRVPSTFTETEFAEVQQISNSIETETALFEREEWFKQLLPEYQSDIRRNQSFGEKGLEIAMRSDEKRNKWKRDRTRRLYFVPRTLKALIPLDLYTPIINLALSLHQFASTVDREMTFEKNYSSPRKKIIYVDHLNRDWTDVKLNVSHVSNSVDQIQRHRDYSNTRRFDIAKLRELMDCFNNLLLIVQRVDTLTHLLAFLDWKLKTFILKEDVGE